MKKISQIGSAQRTYMLLIGIVGLLLVGLVAGAYGTNSLLTTQATKLTSLKAKSLAMAQEQQSLVKAKKDVQTYAGLEKITQAVVPEDKDQAQTVREIVNIAGANGISLAAISFPASTLGASAASSGVANAPASANAPAAASAGASANASKLSQLTPVKNIPGVYDLQIVVQSDTNHPVQYNSFINFLSALEHNRRTAQISTITIAPSTTNHSLLTFTLTLNEYIKP